jgi:hypothetical protein
LKQREQIIKDREDRAGSLENQLKILEQQMENHLSGTKVLPDGRLSSLKKRIGHYQEQLATFSRDLSEEVG